MHVVKHEGIKVKACSSTSLRLSCVFASFLGLKLEIIMANALFAYKMLWAFPDITGLYDLLN